MNKTIKMLFTAAACFCVAVVSANDFQANPVPAIGQNAEDQKAFDPNGTGPRVLFVGNSITLHGPRPSIGWTNNCGMAASSIDKDYVHLLQKKIAAVRPDAQCCLLQVADTFERAFFNPDWSCERKYKWARKFSPDIIVFFFGANVPKTYDSGEMTPARSFGDAVNELRAYLDPEESAVALISQGFYVRPKLDDEKAKVAGRRGRDVFVHLEDVRGRKDTHGRFNHPNDFGMQLIADRFWRHIEPILHPRMARCVVGCNTGAADGQTLHVLECDTATGAASILQTVRGMQGTTYFEFDKKAKRLYSFIGEMVDDRKRGSLASFAFEGGRLGKMEHLSALPCETPCHISLSPDGRYAGFAAYSSATAGVLPLPNGELHTVKHTNEGLGPNKKRQEKAHAHCAFFTPDGRWMGVVDLGKDRILFYEPDTMKPVPEMTVLADPGDGPRHAVWSKDGRFLFVVNELGNSVSSFAFDGAKFVRVGKWSTLPEGCKKETKASAIKLTADGEILMASNRGYDSIAFFAVDVAHGTLALRNIAMLTGSFPRDFELMPGERFMVVGHKMSDEIRVYRFARATCSLEPVGDPISVWRPLCFKFIPDSAGQ